MCGRQHGPVPRGPSLACPVGFRPASPDPTVWEVTPCGKSCKKLICISCRLSLVDPDGQRADPAVNTRGCACICDDRTKTAGTVVVGAEDRARP